MRTGEEQRGHQSNCYANRTLRPAGSHLLSSLGSLLYETIERNFTKMMTDVVGTNKHTLINLFGPTVRISFVESQLFQKGCFHLKKVRVIDVYLKKWLLYFEQIHSRDETNKSAQVRNFLKVGSSLLKEFSIRVLKKSGQPKKEENQVFLQTSEPRKFSPKVE